MQFRTPLISLALLMTPLLAFAHPGHNDSGLISGLSHPLMGLDHLLAMLAVGLWASQQQGNARWALPFSFVSAMLLGSALGVAGFEFNALENSIAASVFALGLLVALALRLPMIMGLGLCSVFALSHGIAHGLELPALASPTSYAVGFVTATVALHACGYALARWLPQAVVPLTRLLGAGCAVAGGWMLAA